MKAGWKSRPIEDVAFIQEGPGIRKYEYQDDGYPMINVRCVQDGYIDMSNARAANLDLATGKWRHFQIESGDILFTTSGTIGRCAIVKESDLPLLMNTSVVRLKPISDDLEHGYLYYFLQSEGFQAPLKALSSGTAIQNVGPTHIKTLQIPLPPLEEQRRIVAVLDEAFTAIATATSNAEKNASNARELARITLLAKTQSLSNGRRPLKEICVVDWGNTNLTKSAYVENGSALAVSAAGCDGRIDHAEHEAGVPVLSAIGARCGRMFLPEEPFTAIKNTITLTPRLGQADGRFLYYLLESVDLPQRGSAQPFIAKGDINQFEVPVPKLEDQKLLVQEMDAVFEQCAGLERLASKRPALLDDLKQSLLQRAFSGQLREREPIAS